MRNILNQKVKHREDFRPFAPSVMAEHADEWFEVGSQLASHEFMLFAPRVKAGQHELIPAVVHRDGTAAGAAREPQIKSALSRAAVAFPCANGRAARRQYVVQ
jgi:predicted NodU family carbamoyl transferase